jgi:hypothetical protein
VVSVYAFSAGTSGLARQYFADRFDENVFSSFFYAGFVLGTLLCGIALNYRSSSPLACRSVRRGRRLDRRHHRRSVSPESRGR